MADAYENEARDLLEYVTYTPTVCDVERVAEALQAAYLAGRDSAAELVREAFIAGRRSMRDEAAKVCERMVIGGRMWTEEQAIAADALHAAADNVRALPLGEGGEP